MMNKIQVPCKHYNEDFLEAGLDDGNIYFEAFEYERSIIICLDDECADDLYDWLGEALGK